MPTRNAAAINPIALNGRLDDTRLRHFVVAIFAALGSFHAACFLKGSLFSTFTQIPGHLRHDWLMAFYDIIVIFFDLNCVMGIAACCMFCACNFWATTCFLYRIVELIMAEMRKTMPDMRRRLVIDPTCCICMIPYHSGSEVPVSLQCGHVFGSKCIGAWLASRGRQARCPTCRRDPAMGSLS